MLPSRSLSWVKPLPLLFVLILAMLSSASYAEADLAYKYLPVEQVESNIKQSLCAHEISADGLNIVSDDKGIVNISGTVASKDQADMVVKIAQANEGVYAVLGELSYFQ